MGNVKNTIRLSLLKDDCGTLCQCELEQIKNMAGSACFIETGTYLGNTAQSMRSVFERVISIELSEELHSAAKTRFQGDKQITLLQGDSAEKMGEALACAGTSRPVIWLDAHWSGGNTARAGENTPILAEIKGIKDAGVVDAIILVDDVSYFWNVRPGFNVHESIGGYPEIGLLMAELTKLNPEFVIFVNGDVMFAIPQSLMNGVEISPVLDATSRLRIGLYRQSDLPHLEAVVARAVGSERGMILRLPEAFSHALSYGIGGHFCYWRGLVHECDGRRDEAASDFDLARSCGVNIPRRSWET